MPVIAATGHRPNKLGGYGNQVHRKLFDLAVEILSEGNYTHAISGMALGWDTAFAEAALKLNIPLIAAIPFQGQETVWRPEQQKRYHKILEKAEVFIISTGGYKRTSMLIRNEWMVDNCDLLCALWDGSKSGTMNCINYAKKKKKPIFNYWNQYIGLETMV